MSQVQIKFEIPESKVVFLIAPYEATCHAISNIVKELCKVKHGTVCDEERGIEIAEKLVKAELLDITGDNLVPLKKINEYISENNLLGEDEYLLIVLEQEPMLYTALVVNDEALSVIREAFSVSGYRVTLISKDRDITVETISELVLRILLEMERAGISTVELEKLLANAESVEDVLNTLSNAGYSVQEVDPSELGETYSYAYKVAITPSTHVYIVLW